VDEVRALNAAQDAALERRALYVAQLEYVNTRLLAAVDAITREDPSAFVIIQSDHGTDLHGDWESPTDAFIRDRLSAFNAYRFPGHEEHVPPGNATNVNTFRYVFNAILDADLEILEDHVYYSRPSAPYRFEDVTALTARS
jgi:hypothetical protein